MKNLILLTASATIFFACIPDSVKERVNAQVADAQKMLADQEFKRAIAHVELHKLRNGSYPASLRDLEFLGATDSAMFAYVNYSLLDSGYELNLKMKTFTFTGDSTSKEVRLTYPPEFWKGLGCVKSNMKKDW